MPEAVQLTTVPKKQTEKQLRSALGVCLCAKAARVTVASPSMVKTGGAQTIPANNTVKETTKTQSHQEELFLN